ncbi:MAG: winged helix-turn-helix domain-containing protein [Pseudomonadota bacterium]
MLRRLLPPLTGDHFQTGSEDYFLTEGCTHEMVRTCEYGDATTTRKATRPFHARVARVCQQGSSTKQRVPAVNPNSVFTLFPSEGALIPRFREAGEVTLDLLHRDGRVEARWLALHPREFSLLWRLASEPGKRVSRRQLLADVWRIQFEPETNSLAVHVARVRAKLKTFGLSHILATHPDGGYYLDAPRSPASYRFEQPAPD